VETAYTSSLLDPMQGAMPTATLVDKREPREVVTGAAVVLLIFGALAVIGMIYPLSPK
jgi:hypothetical protein